MACISPSLSLSPATTHTIDPPPPQVLRQSLFARATDRATDKREQSVPTTDRQTPENNCA